MKLSKLNRARPRIFILSSVGLLVLGFNLGLSSAATGSSTTSGSTSSTTLSAAQQKALANIISKGNQEITRRLTTLNSLSVKINSSTKLTKTDQTTLIDEVNAEVTGLNTLKTQLDADTTVPTAGTDATSIFTEYRVYALVVPKVELIKTADDQQLTESKLSTLAQNLTTQVNTDKTNGKDVTIIETSLTDMTMQITNAQAISSSIEAKVLPLQPSDYNTDQTILTGDYGQLKTAHSDNTAAYNDAKTIISELKAP